MLSLLLVLGFLGFIFVRNIGRFRDFLRIRRICVREFEKLVGPPSLPIIGSAYLFKWNNREFSKQLEDWGREYAMFPGSCGVLRVWLGPYPAAILVTAEALRPLLESTENISKGDEYAKISEWIGTGLLTSTNEKWRARRKMLTPTFHFTVLQRYQEVFARQGKVLVEVLSQKSGSFDGFDVFPYIKRCALDIICETAMGTSVNAQVGGNDVYVDAVHRISELFRFPWLWFKPIWYLTGMGFEFDKRVKLTNDFTRMVIAERKKALEDGDEESGEETQKMSFIDLLLKMQHENKLADEDIREEVDTFMFEGHDTTASGMVFAMWWLGQYPDCQRKVHEELDEVFGDDFTRLPTNEDVKKLVYLEKCIKESLRLLPSVPLMARRLSSDLVLPHPTQGNVVLPEGMTVIFTSIIASRDPRFFEKPEEFYPEHFDAERVAKRDAYTYIPFSAGPRNCIGQKFAILEEKTVLSWVFRWFSVESVEKWPAGRPVPEVILRPYDGVKLKLRRRQQL